MRKKKTIIYIAGPTASGKTPLSIKLGKSLNTEIISCDSRQFYKEMIIGTSVPTSKELKIIPHHFIHHKSIFEKYTLGDFKKEVFQKLKELFVYKDILLLVGGSGLYADSILFGIDNLPDVPQKIRQKLNDDYAKKGITYLQKLLKIKDPDYYKKVDTQNPHRLIRALEVSIFTKKPYSHFLTTTPKKFFFDFFIVLLNVDREKLYKNINQRVEKMIVKGLEKEAKKLFPHRKENALNTLGYKEWFDYFEKKYTSKNEVIEEIKKNTRRYAKRQITWCKRYKDAFIFNPKKNDWKEIIIALEKNN